MTYRLLDDLSGVLLDRKPLLVKGEEVALSFEGAPEGAVAVLAVADTPYYRTLKDGCCTISASKLHGKVRVAVLFGDGGCRRYICEGLLVTPIDGGVLLSPDDMDLPSEVARLRADNSEIRKKNAALEKSVRELAEKFDRMMEGYDIV